MRKRNIYLLCAIALLQGMVFYAPVATLYRQAAGLGIFHITLIESISLALTICLEIPWGWLADRIGYKKTMLACCGLYFLSKMVFWKADGFGMFLLERVLLSIVCAGLSGVDSSMLYLSCTEGTSHRIFGIYESLGQLGMLLAAMAHALWIGSDYRLAAFLTVLSYGAAAVLSLGLQEVCPERRESRASGGKMIAVLKGQLGNKRLLLLLLAVALLNETHQTVTVFFSQLQYIRAGMDHRGISLAYIAASIAALAGGFSSEICRKMGHRKFGAGLMALGAISCLVLGITTHPILSVLAVVALRLCFSLLQPMQMDLQNKLVFTEDRATALSMNAVVMDGLGIFLNLIFGKVADLRLDAALFLGAILCGTAALFYRLSFQQQR